MSDGIYVALSGAIAQQRALDVVANNVANAATTGFRASRVSFREAVANARGAGGPDDPLRYAVVARVRADATEGALTTTGRPLDAAIQGRGYFAVETPAGPRYTRNGAFVVAADGVLRGLGGAAVLDASERPLRLPEAARDVRIEADGSVVADGASVGRLRIVTFASPDALENEGAGLLRPAAGAAPEEARTPVLALGALEGSNVNAVAGLTDLIAATRGFDAFQRVIASFRQIDERTARDVAGRAGG